DGGAGPAERGEHRGCASHHTRDVGRCDATRRTVAGAAGDVTVPARSARARFADVVQKPEPEIDLASAALLIAAEEYPQVAPEPYLRRLDELAERARDRGWDETAPIVMVQEVSRVLFEEEGFRGNRMEYYDPRNSFLNDVIDRRMGIPITL